jgi:hypothetical protein
MKLINKIRLKVICTAIAFAAILANCSPANAQLTEGQAAVVGGIIGYVVGKDKREPVYAPSPYPTYGYPHVSQPPVVIDQSQMQGYNQRDHGYCAVYLNEMYYQCLGNLQRNRNEAAYQRGLYGR